MKGISLPINTIVIIAIAALVLVVLVTVFTSIFGGGVTRITDNEAWSTGCSMALARGCNLDDFAAGGADEGMYIAGYDPFGNDPTDANGLSTCNQGTLDETGCADDTLYQACQRVYGGSRSPEYCRAQCCGASA